MSQLAQALLKPLYVHGQPWDPVLGALGKWSQSCPHPGGSRVQDTLEQAHSQIPCVPRASGTGLDP